MKTFCEGLFWFGKLAGQASAAQIILDSLNNVVKGILSLNHIKQLFSEINWESTFQWLHILFLQHMLCVFHHMIRKTVLQLKVT